MKLRPQCQLRFRDETQFLGVKAKAKEENFTSVNEWILAQIELKVPAAPEEKVVKAKEK